MPLLGLELVIVAILGHVEAPFNADGSPTGEAVSGVSFGSNSTCSVNPSVARQTIVEPWPVENFAASGIRSSLVSPGIGTFIGGTSSLV